MTVWRSGAGESVTGSEFIQPRRRRADGMASRAAISIVLGVLLVCVQAQAAGASSWSVKGIADGSVLSSGVSCVSSSACVAVGNVGDGVTSSAVGDVWNGSEWSLKLPASPSGSTESALSGVSCSSASACTAVGSYKNSAGTRVTLAERWNGSEWSVQSTPNPSGATESVLSGVSCESSACVAVGSYENSSGTRVTLAERWNGSEWSVQSTPNPSGATESVLSGVSCKFSCELIAAVGSYVNSSGSRVTLAERWNGSEWSVQSSPNPSGATESVLSGVSCKGATPVCYAVGSYKGSSGARVVLAERGPGGEEWSLQTVPTPVGASESALSGVSCLSGLECVAVGSYKNGSGTTLTLAERWGSEKWAVQETPNPSGASESTLLGVSCTSKESCLAVGKYQTNGDQAGLSEGLSGTTWSVKGIADGSVLSSGVSCVSSSACVAVGNVGDGVTSSAVGDVWNGSEWSLKLPVSPSGSTESALSGVSCSSASACTAVGSYKNSAGTKVTLAERWNGSEWSVQSTPNPSGATESALSGVSCESSVCVAVGSYKNSAGSRVTLAERWNGSEWSVQSTPNPSGATESALSGVSCHFSCEIVAAVGSYVNSAGSRVTLVERWNGSEWSVQSTPNPSGATESVLSGVSCKGASLVCYAVGSYKSSSGARVVLAERGPGGEEWALQSVPTPTGASESALSGVSCLSGLECVAVGSYKNSSGTTLTLAEGWSSEKWAVQETPNPSGASESTLLGVSCASKESCLAVGKYQTNGDQASLSELYS